MKKILFIILAVFTLVLASCSEAAADEGASGQNSDEYFEVKLFTNKTSYSPSEPIICYATVKYVGEGDGITIYSADPLVGFALKDGKYFDGDLWVSYVQITTEFKKGEPVTYEYVKSGGCSSDDPNAEFYKQFYSEKQLILPPGDYVITAAINGSFNKDDNEGTKYSLSASVNIRVE